MEDWKFYLLTYLVLGNWVYSGCCFFRLRESLGNDNEGVIRGFLLSIIIWPILPIIIYFDINK